jgi:hypothetical protein
LLACSTSAAMTRLVGLGMPLHAEHEAVIR